MDNDDEYERTLCQLPQCHVFKIPARSTAAGHRAADWPTEPQWTGKVKVVAKGKMAAVFLLNKDDNKVFACCPVTDDAAVERVVDSGRYFVLRITNPQGQHAFIGIAFNERNDAFDFNVALSEHKASVEREEKPVEVAASLGNLTLGEGQKIKLKGLTSGGGSPKEKKSGGGGAFLLAPPPRDHHIKGGVTYGGSKPGAVQTRPGVAKPSPAGADLLGGGDDLLSLSMPSSTAAPAAPAAPAVPAAPAAVQEDPFAAFTSPPAQAPQAPPSASTMSPQNSVGAGCSPMPAATTPDDPFGGFSASSPAAATSVAPISPGFDSFSPSGQEAAAPPANVFDGFSPSSTVPVQQQQQANGASTGGGGLLDF